MLCVCPSRVSSRFKVLHRGNSQPRDKEQSQLYIKNPDKMRELCEKQGMHPLAVALSGEHATG